MEVEEVVGVASCCLPACLPAAGAAAASSHRWLFRQPRDEMVVRDGYVGRRRRVGR